MFENDDEMTLLHQLYEARHGGPPTEDFDKVELRRLLEREAEDRLRAWFASAGPELTAKQPLLTALRWLAFPSPDDRLLALAAAGALLDAFTLQVRAALGDAPPASGDIDRANR